jgi:magnesium-transporting ATPase (P-type)
MSVHAPIFLTRAQSNAHTAIKPPFLSHMHIASGIGIVGKEGKQASLAAGLSVT